MKNLEELETCIIHWAYDRELVKADNTPKQRLKLIEESGELANAILKSNVKDQMDALGDMFVVLVILSAQLNYNLRLSHIYKFEDDVYSSDVSMLIHEVIHYAQLGSINSAMATLKHLSITLGYDLTECANLAYEVIKNRKGETINGTFIKDE